MIVFYDGAGFNAVWVASKTQAEFIAHELHNGMTDAQLKEAYKLCKEAVKVKPEQA